MKRSWFTRFVSALIIFSTSKVNGRELTPPFSQLTELTKIRATSTCGDQGPEMYCDSIKCDICDKDYEPNYHPPEFAIDGFKSKSSWLSSPLSRGEEFEQVNVTIDLGQEYEVGYILITFGNTPRPAVWSLEKSSDFGVTWKPWQYFARTRLECEEYFGKTDAKIAKDDSVVCEAKYFAPRKNDEVFVSLVEGRPSWIKVDQPESSAYWEWIKATNIRLRLLRLYKNDDGIVEEDDLHNYYYSIKDISIGGRCQCNGHAQMCDLSPDSPSAFNITPGQELSEKMMCKCEHNTCGAKCDQCCPGFQAVPWRPSRRMDPFECQTHVDV